MPVKLSEIDWKPIKSYDYMVSSSGLVKSIDRVIVHKNGRVHKYPSKILKYFITEGYRRVGIYNEKKRRNVLIHELVAIAFIGDKPKELEINHKDGNKENNNFSNLEYVTRSQNSRHAWNMGLCRKIYTSRFKDISCVLCKKIFRPKGDTTKSCSRKCSAIYRRNQGKRTD